MMAKILTSSRLASRSSVSRFSTCRGREESDTVASIRICRNRSIVCVRPSSMISNSSLARSVTGLPRESLAMTSTQTTLTPPRNVACAPPCDGGESCALISAVLMSSRTNRTEMRDVRTSLFSRLDSRGQSNLISPSPSAAARLVRLHDERDAPLHTSFLLSGCHCFNGVHVVPLPDINERDLDRVAPCARCRCGCRGPGCRLACHLLAGGRRDNSGDHQVVFGGARIVRINLGKCHDGV